MCGVRRGCSWCADGRSLVTGSRDGQCKRWRVSTETCSATSVWTPFEGVAVTAVDCLAHVSASVVVVACGNEQGEILIGTIHEEDGSSSFTPLHTVSSTFAHGKAVNRVRWNPAVTLASDGTVEAVQLLSCGDDHSLRIHSFKFP